jgi:hypothetical protein
LSGYAPLFSSLTTGTLCGKWPDIGLWPIVLSLSDWRGVVDVTPDYLSRVTGLPLQEVVACMGRFCEPDPYSRSEAHEGRRLLLLEPDKRNWGWKIVNLQLYRDRASGQDQIADGRNAEKVRRYKERHRRTPADTGGHPETPGTPGDTDSYSYSYSDKSKSARKARGSRLPEDFSPDLEYAKQQISDIDADGEAQRFRDYWKSRSGSAAVKADWPATWRNWIRNCKDSGKYARQKEASRATNGLPILNG